ncbi:hypothetical protein Rs2_16248 [Raphanus sativus]|nr:hypothetical protein Rs2_16248 [Raphanus sativus]
MDYYTLRNKAFFKVPPTHFISLVSSFRRRRESPPPLIHLLPNFLHLPFLFHSLLILTPLRRNNLPLSLVISTVLLPLTAHPRRTSPLHFFIATKHLHVSPGTLRRLHRHQLPPRRPAPSPNLSAAFLPSASLSSAVKPTPLLNFCPWVYKSIRGLGFSFDERVEFERRKGSKGYLTPSQSSQSPPPLAPLRPTPPPSSLHQAICLLNAHLHYDVVPPSRLSTLFPLPRQDLSPPSTPPAPLYSEVAFFFFLLELRI